jgi:biopolymer transport protein ExbB
MKMKKYLPLLLLGFFFLVPKAHAAYTYTRSITVTSTASVASGTNANFPMLVSSTLATWESSSTAGGAGHIQNLVTAPNGGQAPADLIFATSTACSALNFEVEQYVSSTGAMIAWVNVPSVSTGTVIYACYGDATVTTDQSHPSSTWNSNYAEVFHLPTRGTVLNASDSTAFANNGVITGVKATTTGEIDGAGIWGASTTDKIVTGLQTATTTRTYEIWSYKTGDGGGALGRMFEKRGLAAAQSELLFFTGGDYEYDRVWSGGIDQWDIAAPSANAWHSIAVTYDSSNASNSAIMYVDGAAQSLVTNITFAGTLVNNPSGYTIGNRQSDNARNWAGSLDEFRVVNAIMTPSWILTEYNNQSSPSTFYAIGAETGGSVASSTPGNPILILKNALWKLNGALLRLL